MPSSLRDRLADLYAYSTSGTDGIVGSTYTRVTSGDAGTGGMYWCRFTPVSAVESPIAGQQQHVIGAVGMFGEDAAAALSVTGLVYVDGLFYKIGGVVPLRLPGETEYEITADYISDEVYDSLVGGP